MQLFQRTIIVIFFCFPLFLIADSDHDRHFRLSAWGMVTGDADFTTPGFTDQHLSYSYGETRATYTHPFSDGSGMFGGVGYSMTEVDWAQNPSFSEKDFSYVNFFIGGYTHCIEGWLWLGELQVGHDPEANDFSHYTLYRTTLWGRFFYRRDLDIHAGFVAHTGIRNTKIYPIIGAVWNPHDRWEIHAVVPVDMGVYYTLTQQLNAGINVRFLWDRHRVSNKEAMPKAIFEYREIGVEAIAKYCPFSQMIFKIFAGSTAGGNLKVSNHKGRMSIRYKLDDTFYSGVEMEVEF